MTSLRKHFKVAWNGGEPVDIVTNARDVAEAGELETTKVATGYAIVYSALQRNGFDVPGSFEDFIDQLDEMTAGQNGAGQVDPTQPQVSTGEPLP